MSNILKIDGCKVDGCQNARHPTREWPFCDACMINTAIDMLHVASETQPIEPEKLNVQNVASLLACFELIQADYKRMVLMAAKSKRKKEN